VSAARIRVVARFRPGDSPLSSYCVVSLLAHVVIVVGLLSLPSFGRDSRAMPPTIEVVMLAAAPAAATAGPAPTTREQPLTEPEPPPVPAEGVTATQDEPSTPDPLPENPEPREQTPPAQPRETPANDDPEPGEGRESVGGPSGEADLPVGALEGMGSEFDWYRGAVIRALYAAWQQPFLAANRDVLEVGVAFDILPDGGVRAVRVANTSGVAALDRSALRAVYDATLPPLPGNFRNSTQPALFTFRLFPDQ